MPITEETLPEIIDAIRFSLDFRIFDNALLLCEEAFAFQKSPQIIALYAKTYLEMGSPKQASILCKNNIYTVVSSPETVIIYAKSLIESGDYISAEEVLSKFLKSDTNPEPNPFKLAATYYLGVIMCRTSRFQSAQPHLEESYRQNRYLLTAQRNMYLDIIPNSRMPVEYPDNLCTLTLIENSDKNPDDIPFPDYFKQSVPYLVQKANYFFHQSNFNLATRTYKEIYQKYPYNTHGMAYYSTSLWQLKDPITLEELSRYFMDVAPGDPETWVICGNLFSLQHISDKAIVYFERASNIDKTYSYGLTLAGHEYMSLGRDSDAQNRFRESVKRAPLDYSSWYGLGTILYKERKYGAARYYIRKAQMINKMSSVLASILAQTELRCGDVEKAIDLFRRSIEMDNKNFAARFQLGCALQEQEKLDEAQEELENVSSYAPDEPVALFKLGQIHLQKGENEIAMHLFVQALVYGYPTKSDIYEEVEGILDQIITKILK